MKTATKTNINVAVKGIAEKAVFLSLHFHRFGNRRKVASTEIEVDAEKQRVKVSKVLLDSNELKAIEHLDAEINDYVISRCLPYDKSLHVLPLGLVEEIEETLERFVKQRQELIETATERYPELLDAARGPLGALFNRRDYPSQGEFQRRFRVTWNYVSLSTPGKLAEISPRLFSEERRKISERMEESYTEWRDLLRIAMADMVKRLCESLQPDAAGKVRKLTDSSVNRLKEFLSTFSFRNITNDQELEQISDQLKAIVGGITPDKLRESENMKAMIGEKLSQAAATLEVMTQGIRKIRSEEE
jgi:hypothetical protein